MNNPREWWICESTEDSYEDSGCVVTNIKDLTQKGKDTCIHVIEKSAYEELKKKHDWYQDHHMTPLIEVNQSLCNEVTRLRKILAQEASDISMNSAEPIPLKVKDE